MAEDRGTEPRDEEEVFDLIRPSEQKSLVEQVEEQVRVAVLRAQALRTATLKMTLPSDWIDQNGMGYLQWVGGQRIMKPWGISIDRPEVKREALPNDHFRFTVWVAGRSSMTGETQTEVGTRSTVGSFFKGRYERASDDEKEQILDDVMKSAIANAKGRLVRVLTGTNGIPIQDLKELGGFDTSRVSKVERQTGARGGTKRGSGGTDRMTSPQKNFLVSLVAKTGIVDGYKGKGKTVDEQLAAANPSKDDASDFIKALQEHEKNSTTMPEAVYHSFIGSAPAGDEPPPPEDE